jgi:hypothetical protein
MERLRELIWRIFLTPEQRELKKKEYIARSLCYYLEHSSGGGTGPLTFKDKLTIIVVIGLGILVSAGYLYLLSLPRP